jgi:hypothetical protein
MFATCRKFPWKAPETLATPAIATLALGIIVQATDLTHRIAAQPPSAGTIVLAPAMDNTEVLNHTEELSRKVENLISPLGRATAAPGTSITVPQQYYSASFRCHATAGKHEAHLPLTCDVTDEIWPW